MLSCPICQTALDDDSIQGGRCFSCGSQVVWQGEEKEEAVGAGALAKGGMSSGSSEHMKGEDGSSAAVDAPADVAMNRPVPPPKPIVIEPIEQAAEKPKSRQLSMSQNNAIRTMWQGTVAPTTTPMTSIPRQRDDRNDEAIVACHPLARANQGNHW